jgi:flagellar capping protein FliD
MAVMMPREKWTDERLDDLNGKVNKGFARTETAIAETKAEISDLRRETKGEIKELRREMHAGFNKVDARFDKMDDRFEKMNDRFDRLSQILIGGTIAIIVALIGSSAL